MFSRAKDLLVQQTALPYLNNLLAPYGRATRLEIDSTAKTIRLEVELNGEASPLEVEILDYELTEEEDRYFALVKGVRTSREWLTRLARDRLVGSRFELPPNLGRILIKAL